MDSLIAKNLKRLLWFLLAGTKGGVTRIYIIKELQDKPKNANQLSKLLGLDYKTIQHHLRVLGKNRIISSMGDGYGSVYDLSAMIKANPGAFNEIWEKLNKH